MPLPSIDRFESLTDADFAELRAVLAEQGFVEATAERIEQIFAAAPSITRIPLVRDELRRRIEPGEHLGLLLTYGGWLPRARVEALLGARLTRALLGAGVLVETADGVVCPFRVDPERGLWFLADILLGEPDSVMPPGPTTTVLDLIMPAQITGAMLDVGCGPGSLALHAARRGAPRVVGTDINPRAIAMARFNAKWNGLAAEFRVGDLLEPAQGERFDLVISQPPFIARPPHASDVTFLYGGARGDEVFRRLIGGLDRVLTPDGEALILCDVALGKNDSMGRYVRDLPGIENLHVMALHVTGPDVATHALLYSSQKHDDGNATYRHEVPKHHQHMQAMGIEHFRHTLFVFRRPAAARREVWRTDLALRELFLVTAENRARLWECLRSAGESDAVLMRRRIRVAPDAQWVSLRAAPEGDHTEHRVRFGPKWPALEQIVTDEGLALASLLERSPDVETAIAGYAELCEARPDEVRGPLLDYIRKSLLGGMLVPEANGHGD